MATSLVDICASLSIPIRIMETHTSPQLHRVRLEPGVNSKGRLTKLCSIRSRTEDIALAIGTYPVTTSQDQSGFWLEVPRLKRPVLTLDDMKDQSGYRLPIVLGMGIYNEPVIVDLAEPNTPHMLVAGTTGSGKTVLLKAILAHLMRCTESWNMVVIDTKQDLRAVAGDPRHVTFLKPRILSWWQKLLKPKRQVLSNSIITSPAMAEMALNTLYAQCQARQRAQVQEPRILLVIDEYADLVLANKAMMMKTVRLAQIGRSAGIHMILATQRPSVKVVSGLIKANFPVRVALKVVTKVDSKVILDTGGAEKLLGKGDGLVLLNGKLVRFQGPYVSDKEVVRIINGG